jgi:hypothetical protein
MKEDEKIAWIGWDYQALTANEAALMAARPRLKLTANQLHLLRALARLLPLPGQEINSTALVGKVAGVPVRSLLGASIRDRARGLQRRGFLCSRYKGPYHLWRLGPLSDELKDVGLLE